VAIDSINVPLNPKNNQNRGFGFIEFATREQGHKVIEECHGKNFKGRNITVEFALSKETYALKVQHTVDNTNLDSKGVIAGKLQKQETASKT
jgi:RNA recognition motif-containing protein